ncbi:MAG: helicase-related protein, partial [Akkermansia sp.]
GNMSLQELVLHFADSGHDSALFIVNLTRQAQDLYRLLENQGASNVFHLSARMCPAHRTAVLDEVRERLSAGLPTILVSTRVVEAGVDVSFPIVYRDACGLDSLAQAAGRCNRHGELPMGAVYSFKSTEYSLPDSFVTLRDAVAAWENTLPNLGDKDWFSIEAVESYFRHFYWQRGAATGHWDAKDILSKIGNQPRELEPIPFRKIASLFRLIDAETHSVMVPYGPEADKLAEHLRELNRAAQMPSREIFRKIQQFTVSVYDTEAKDLPCEILHEKAGVYLMNDTARYDTCMGLLREPPNDNYIQ